MALDTRDWYRDLLRKKTAYVEKAGFRRNLGEAHRTEVRKRYSARQRNWSWFWFVWAGALLYIAVKLLRIILR